MKPCIKCGLTDRYKSGLCRPCQKARMSTRVKNNPEKNRANAIAWQKANPEKNRANAIAWQKANPGKCCAITAKRAATKLQATPKWFEKDLIEALYEEANRITIETGIKHNVDHVVPLQSKIVSGLHCLANLQIITAKDNQSKNNRYWPDMPKEN